MEQARVYQSDGVAQVAPPPETQQGLQFSGTWAASSLGLVRASAEISATLDRQQRIAVVMLELNGTNVSHSSTGAWDMDTDVVVAALQARLVGRMRGLVLALSAERFAILLPGLEAIDAEQWLIELAGDWAGGVKLADHVWLVDACAGVSAAPVHSTDPTRLLQMANAGLRAARQQQATIVTYSATKERRRLRNLTLRGELSKAVARNQLHLQFQPQLDLATRTVSQFEALVRWRHPQLGEILPGEFIGLAEQSGMIGGITRWVLDTAIGHLAQWHAAGRRAAVSVNLSSHDLTSGHLEECVLEPLSRCGIPGSFLTLEVTEHAVVADLERAAGVLRELQRHGVRISLDDFGTGYASLEVLRALPIAELKVERTFTRQIASEPRDRTIVAGAVSLAHSLGLQVVAEGVESMLGLRIARSLGCDRVQGYLIGRPGDVTLPEQPGQLAQKSAP